MAIYLDNAATSFPKPEPVIQTVEHVLRCYSGSGGRGLHASALDADRLILSAREALATLFGVEDSSRIAFMPSATHALNQALFGLLKAGDRVVTSSLEHNAIIRPLYRLQQQGVETVRVDSDPSGGLDPQAVIRAIDAQTRLVVLSHASNVTGWVLPLQEIGAACRRHGALFLVDASQTVGHIDIDLAQLDVDLLAAPGHKGLLGPQGTGILFVRPGLDLEPLILGGTGNLSSDPQAPAIMPERYEAGTLNLPGIAGLGAGVHWLLEQGVAARQARLNLRLKQLKEGLASLQRLTLYDGPESGDNCGVLSIAVDGMDPAEIGFRLDREFEIAVRVGLHCAPEAHRSIGTFPGGTVRFSPSAETTESDIHMTIDAMRSVVG